MKNLKKTVALENVNMMLVNQKIDAYLAEHRLTASEENCRLVKMTLRHKVHHFPMNIPFIAAVKKCRGEQQVVFNIKRAKLSCIDDISVSSESKVGDSFSIGNVDYEKADTINGFARYRPTFK